MAEPSWALPLQITRVSTQDNQVILGIGGWLRLIQAKDQPFISSRNICVADAAYSTKAALNMTFAFDNAILISRLRGNRNMYRAPAIAEADVKKKRGHPKWYGDILN